MIRTEQNNDSNKIILELSSPATGELLTQITGTTAEEISFKLAKLDLISLPRHWIYIGLELMKAEHSLWVGKEYKQDKPLF